MGLPNLDYIGIGGQIGNNLGSALRGFQHRSMIDELGTAIQKKDFDGAAATAIKAGDIDTGLKLMQMGMTNSANARADEAINGALGGAPMSIGALGNGPQAPPAPAMPGVNGSSSSAGLDASREAIAKIESSGRYDALGPLTKGDRAYGRYQVMGANVPTWTKQALGYAMSPEQFLHNPKAQDAVFNKIFGGYSDKYGSPQEAASLWFTGRPMARGGNASDVTGTTGNEYVRRFNEALKGSSGRGGTAPVQVADASGGVPASSAPAGQQDALMGRLNALGRALATPNISPAARARLEDAIRMTEYAISRQDRQDTLTQSRQDRAEERALRQEDRATARQDRLENQQYRREEMRLRREQTDPSHIHAARDAEAERMGLKGEDRQLYVINGHLPPKSERQTSDQANAALYASRMQEADKIISDPTVAKSSMGMQGVRGDLLDKVPYGNVFQSGDRQKYDQAKTDFMTAVLRRESGAAISKSEFATADKQYFPQVGDTPEKIAQKAQNRRTAIEGIARAATPSFREEFSAKNAAQPQQRAAPARGALEDGYRFKGGDPADPKSWVKVQ